MHGEKTVSMRTFYEHWVMGMPMHRIESKSKNQNAIKMMINHIPTMAL